MDRNRNKSIRQETDQEYIVLMKEYIQNKYSINVNVVEHIFPADGINTALKENVVVFTDENGIVANVKARLSSPYSFYDDYVESRTAFEIQRHLNIHITAAKTDAKIYVAIRNKDNNNIDTSPSNVSSLTFVATVDGHPSDTLIEELYGVYSQIQEKEYTTVFFLVGFTDGSAEFSKAINNYMIFGKSAWKDYSGEVYAELYTTENNLTFEEFKNKLK